METLEKTSEELLQAAIDRFWETVPPVWLTVRGNLRSIATQSFNMSVEQFRILRHIHNGHNSVSDLAEAKQISRPAVSQAVELLVQQGCITRRQSSEDRRCVKLELTPKGTAILNNIFDRNSQWMVEKLEALSPEQLGELLTGLEILKTAFKD
jgi:MarR family 2-MHQ and catechol resistance regulon transcriptional repressor